MMKSLLFVATLLFGGVCNASNELPIVNVPVIGVGEVQDPGVFDFPPTYHGCTKSNLPGVSCNIPTFGFFDICLNFSCNPGSHPNMDCIDGYMENLENSACFIEAKTEFLSDCVGLWQTLAAENDALWDEYGQCIQYCGQPPSPTCAAACCSNYNTLISIRIRATQEMINAELSQYLDQIRTCAESSYICYLASQNCCEMYGVKQ